VWTTVVGAVLGQLVVASGPGFNRLLAGDLSSRYEGVEYLGLGEREGKVFDEVVSVGAWLI
jgi:hypothetical protein